MLGFTHRIKNFIGKDMIKVLLDPIHKINLGKCDKYIRSVYSAYQDASISF